MKILILGASGLVGSNCLNYFSADDAMEVVGTSFSYPTADTVPFDTLNPTKADNFDVIGFHPDVVLHCGALTWVDYCEQHPEESYLKTVQSTKNVIELCKQTGAKMVYISSDYVFDGKNGPYTEDHPVNPISVYAAHKLEAEQLVLEAFDNSLAIRITNVYGDEERNKNFIARMLVAIENKEALHMKLPFDQYATPVNANDVARCLYLLITDNKSGIYNVASTDFMNRVQLANRVLSYYNEHNITIESISTAELNQPAPRPLMGGLIAAKFLAEYPEFEFTNVDDYLMNKLAEQYEENESL